MESVHTNEQEDSIEQPRRNVLHDKQFLVSLAISILFLGWLFASGVFSPSKSVVSESAVQAVSGLEAAVFPTNGIGTTARWGSVIPQLVERGVIDREEFIAIFEQGDTPLSEEEVAILDRPQREASIVFTAENSRFTVDVLWALGLAQQSDVLDKGPMRTAGTPTEQFASTGGWNLGTSTNPMDYYSKWNLLGLTNEDQSRVTRIAETIYRPCCGNSTAFPDCNHGMAMLGLIELMVSQGASDDEIYAAVKAANTYWFPDSTLEIATYLTELKDMAWNAVDPRIVVGQEYASGQGARKVKLALQEAGLIPKPPQGGGSCGA